MGTKNNILSGLIGGILFAILSLWQFISLIRFFSLINVLLLGGYVVITVALFMQKRNVLPVVGFGIITFADLISFFRGFTISRYSIQKSSYLSGTSMDFNFFCTLPALLILAASAIMVFLTVCTMTGALQKQNSLVKKIWFVPAVVHTVSLIGGILLRILYRDMTDTGIWLGGGSYQFMSSNINQLLFAGGLLAVGMWILKLSELPLPSADRIQPGSFNSTGSSDWQNQTSYSGYNTEAAIQPQDGYCDLVKHILLLLFTFGIWYFIWIYRTTRYLNRVEGEEYRNPTNKVLLCIFVPFYLIYWVYQSARRIDRLAASRGVSSDLTVLCLILAIFVGIIPPMLMQEKLNSIIGVEAGHANDPSAFRENTGESADFQQSKDAPDPSSGTQTAGSDVAAELKTYKDLLDSGIITQEEFDAKKKQLLNL